MNITHKWLLKNSLLVMSSLFLVLACNEKKEIPLAENPIDCVRKFIDATLHGDFDKANFYMKKDSLNATLLKSWHTKFIHLSKDELNKYASSNIQILQDSIINDTLSIIVYQNSFKKIPTKVKILKKQDSFFVDLKCIFYGTEWY